MRTSHDAPGTVTRLRYWGDDAACRDLDPNTFFPPTYTGTDLMLVATAKAICARCPVSRDCLSHALDRDERDGVFGGYTPDERQDLKADRQRGREGPHAAA